jgi:archaeoflavoprotein AfpA
MTAQNLEIKKEINPKKRVAWGITGSGDRLAETIEIMKVIEKKYSPEVRITIYLSKSGDQVLKFYNLFRDLKENFQKVRTEVNSNNPTLAVQLQTGKIEFLLIAPATSNTVAKLANGISDTLLTNSAIMALKSFVPVFVMPCDYREGATITQLPNGDDMKIRVRKEDVANTKKIGGMDGIFLLENPEEINQLFQKYFGSK